VNENGSDQDRFSGRQSHTAHRVHTSWLARACAALIFSVAAAFALPAQTFKTLYSFTGGADGYYPGAALVQGNNGMLYATTTEGGGEEGGTVFEITPGGHLTVLNGFLTADGFESSALVQAGNGTLYGAAVYGGAYKAGTVFTVTPAGSLAPLYSFCSQSGCADGSTPQSAVLAGLDGNFYGTTTAGGANCVSQGGCGTAFKITPGGALSTLYNFCSQTNCADGFLTWSALVQGTDGAFYGTAAWGGVGGCFGSGCGTIFKITPAGQYSVMYRFCAQLGGCLDGGNPVGGLVEGLDGNFYGTTWEGGANGGGTVFKMTPAGTLTTLYSFCSQTNCADGSSPETALIQGTDGNIYGTTSQGGGMGGNAGTLFKVTTSGALSTLYSFCSQQDCEDGAGPSALIQDTNGTFYGTTGFGGSTDCPSGCGTVFSLAVGLHPFVAEQPTAGKVGTPVRILGTNLTGATSVTFNGAAATFRVISSSLITTTVPAGATSGRVEVTTPGGTLSSNKPFRVKQ